MPRKESTDKLPRRNKNVHPVTGKEVRNIPRERKKGIPKHLARGVFHPELVGVCKGYASTLEIWEERSRKCREQVIRLNAEGRCNRTGMPNGWSRRRPELEAVRARAAVEAKEIMKTMLETGIISKDDLLGNEALEFAITTVRAVSEAGQPAVTTRDRLAAAKMVLEYTKSKPASKIEATVAKAEDFLALLALKG